MIQKYYVYKGFSIWKTTKGYHSDVDDNEKYYPTLKSVKDRINEALKSGEWVRS